MHSSRNIFQTEFQEFNLNLLPTTINISNVLSKSLLLRSQDSSTCVLFLWLSALFTLRNEDQDRNNYRLGLQSVSRILIRVGSTLVLVGWIRIQKGKNERKNRKSGEISCFEVLNILFWGLKASPLARTDVLYKGVRISKYKFLIKKEFYGFSCNFFSSSIFGNRNPGSGFALTLNARVRTLPTVQTPYLWV